MADRPAEVASVPPHSATYFGSPAPDAGYVLRLIKMMEPSITGAEGIERHDLRAGIQATALRRASVLGRAPVRSDVEWALAYWGFGLAGRFSPADPPPCGLSPDERSRLFAGAAHDWLVQRRLAQHPPVEVLRLHPGDELAAALPTRRV